MAVALLRPGWQRDYEGRPPIHAVAGAGRIANLERRDDGTYDLELHGVGRVVLEELPPGELLYRRARATALVDRPTDVGANDVGAMVACASRIAGVIQKEHPTFTLEVSPGERPGLLADRIADRLIADPDVRQRILEALDVRERIALVTDEVADLLARIGERGTAA
jgi:Lon protease-like protein